MDVSRDHLQISPLILSEIKLINPIQDGLFDVR